MSVTKYQDEHKKKKIKLIKIRFIYSNVYTGVILAKKSHFNLSELLSISLCHEHLEYITKKFEAFGIGNNEDGRISLLSYPQK